MSAVISETQVLPALDGVLCQQLQSFMQENIPLTRAMQIQLNVNDTTLIIKAPLAPNINDKGTGFGGAITSLLTLAGWGWLWLMNSQHDYSREIVIHRSESIFSLPVKEEICVICKAPDFSDWRAYQNSLTRKGRARLTLTPNVILSNGEIAASLDANYVTLKANNN